MEGVIAIFMSLGIPVVALITACGVLADYLIGIDTGDLYFYLILAVGMGVGMLAAFFIEMKLSEKDQNKED